MGLFDAILNKNSTTNEASINMNTIGSDFVKGKNYVASQNDEETVLTYDDLDEETAMKIGAIFQGITIISDTISSLSCYLFKDSDGYNEVFYNDPRSRVLSGMANEVLSAFNLKKSMIKDVILYGNAYAKIEREGKNISLRYLPVNVVTPAMDNNGYYFEVASYSTEVNGENCEKEIVDFADMLILTRHNKYNSIVGKGLLDYANEILSMSSQESKYMYGLLANGLSAKAILTSSTPYRKEIKEKLKQDLRSFYSGANNSGKMMLLEGDVKIIPLTLTPTDLRLIESKNFTIAEIARFLNIPKHMLGLDRQQGTYSNITQERLQLLTNTLMPYVTMIEQAMTQKLLTPQEIEQGYYFEFDTSELMKMTPEDQSSYMLKLFDANIVTIEEVRSALGLGGDAETIAQLKRIQEAKISSAITTYSDTPQENNTTEEVVENTEQ